MNEIAIKEIVCGFIKQPAEKINAESRIDRIAVGSSIILHRMHAKLAEAGFDAGDYFSINTYGELLNRLNGSAYESGYSSQNSGSQLPSLAILPALSLTGQGEQGIGVDIESSDNLPRVGDFREDIFYKSNFDASEISYCILQPDPYASFTGLFAAKEAIIKTGNAIKPSSFNKIVIGHSKEGMPVFPGFKLSISHTNGLAVAVAIAGANFSEPAISPIEKPVQYRAPSKWPLVFSVIALILAIISLCVVLKD